MNPALDAFDSSTPVDNLSWKTDAENSAVFFPGGRVALDGTAKDITLPTVEDVIICEPVITSTPAVEEAVPVVSAEEKLPKQTTSEQSDCAGEFVDFAKTGIRNSQPFSPSSDSEIEYSVIESVDDTISAAIDNQPMPEVEVDLASQFEKLVLSKQPSAEVDQPAANENFEREEETSAVILNQTVSLEAETYEKRLDETVSLGAETCEEQANQAVSLETEVNEQSENVGTQQEVVSLATSTAESSSENKPAETTNQQLPISVDCAVEKPETSECAIVEQIPSASPLDGVQEKFAITTIEGAAVVIESLPEQSALEPRSMPEEKPIVPKKGYDLSFLDKFDNLENATPSISHAKLPIPSSTLASIQAPSTPESTFQNSFPLHFFYLVCFLWPLVRRRFLFFLRT